MRATCRSHAGHMQALTPSEVQCRLLVVVHEEQNNAPQSSAEGHRLFCMDTHTHTHTHTHTQREREREREERRINKSSDCQSIPQLSSHLPLHPPPSSGHHATCRPPPATQLHDTAWWPHLLPHPPWTLVHRRAADLLMVRMGSCRD